MQANLNMLGKSLDQWPLTVLVSQPAADKPQCLSEGVLGVASSELVEHLSKQRSLHP